MDLDYNRENIHLRLMRYNYLIKSALIAALGGLLFGFDTAVISGTTTALEEVYGLSKFSLGLTVAVALIGTIIGALVAARNRRTYRGVRRDREGLEPYPSPLNIKTRHVREGQH